MDHKRLEYHLENWASWMRKPAHRLGYPSSSLCMVSGGESTEDAFEIMCDCADVQAARQLDAIIDGLPINQQTALHHRWLHSVYKMRDYEDSLSDAMSNLMAMVNRRGMT